MADLPDPPANIARLPRDHRGYPVPWFVEWIDGKPDFRIASGRRFRHALRLNLCWVCGTPRSRRATFVVGPMCAINRTSSEPPSHRVCAVYAAQACPFLTDPARRRGGAHLPDDYTGPAGVMIERNPGVSLLWTSRDFAPYNVHAQGPANAGTLIDIGTPTSVEWWAHGRAATRAEVLASIDDGLPALAEIADAQGPEAARALTKARVEIEAFLPVG